MNGKTRSYQEWKEQCHKEQYSSIGLLRANVHTPTHSCSTVTLKLLPIHSRVMTTTGWSLLQACNSPLSPEKIDHSRKSVTPFLKQHRSFYIPFELIMKETRPTINWTSPSNEIIIRTVAILGSISAVFQVRSLILPNRFFRGGGGGVAVSEGSFPWTAAGNQA